jgi:ribonuclease HI
MTIYTDGGNSAKTGVGGWGLAVVDRNGLVVTKLSQAYDNKPTNNHMELAGAIYALSYMLDHPEFGTEVTVVSDSEYVVLGASKWLKKWKARGWKATSGPVKNRELWECIDQLQSQLNVTWKWVRGHDGNEFNELVDRLAVGAYKKLLKDRVDNSSCPATLVP